MEVNSVDERTLYEPTKGLYKKDTNSGMPGPISGIIAGGDGSVSVNHLVGIEEQRRNNKTKQLVQALKNQYDQPWSPAQSKPTVQVKPKKSYFQVVRSMLSSVFSSLPSFFKNGKNSEACGNNALVKQAVIQFKNATNNDRNVPNILSVKELTQQVKQAVDNRQQGLPVKQETARILFENYLEAFVTQTSSGNRTEDDLKAGVVNSSDTVVMQHKSSLQEPWGDVELTPLLSQKPLGDVGLIPLPPKQLLLKDLERAYQKSFESKSINFLHEAAVVLAKNAYSDDQTFNKHVFDPQIMLKIKRYHQFEKITEGLSQVFRNSSTPEDFSTKANFLLKQKCPDDKDFQKDACYKLITMLKTRYYKYLKEEASVGQVNLEQFRAKPVDGP